MERREDRPLGRSDRSAIVARGPSCEDGVEAGGPPGATPRDCARAAGGAGRG
jgi:hypothetical protein